MSRALDYQRRGGDRAAHANKEAQCLNRRTFVVFVLLLQASLREHLLGKLSSARGISVRVNGPLKAEQRLPNTLSVGLKGVHSGHLLVGIKDAVAASAGSACHTGGGVSAILTAMEVPMEFATGTLRLSVGKSCTRATLHEWC